MIRKLNKKDFLTFQQFCFINKKLFIVQNDQKVFLDNEKLIKYTFNKILKSNFEGYIIDNKDCDGILLISFDYGNYHLSFDAKNLKSVNHLLKYLFWNSRIKKYNIFVNEKDRLRYVAKTYHFNYFSKNKDELHLVCKRIKK